MSQFGQNSQSFRQVMVSGVPTPLASGTFKSLAPEQIGLFAINENGNITIATGSEAEDVQFQLAQGIHDFAAKGKAFGGGQTNAPRKTKSFKPSEITSWKGVKSNRNHQGQKVALGYDGVDAAKTLTALLDVKDLVVNIRLWGNLINKVTGNRKDLKYKVYVNKGCLSNGCDVNSVVAGETIADSIIKQVEESHLTFGYKITDLIKVSKIKKYAVDPSAPTGLIPFHRYTVAICDDGSNAALGLVQAQYSTLEVKRIDRTSSISTYEVWTQDTFSDPNYTATAPANVSLSARTVADCETCPSGSTKVNSAKAYRLVGLAGTSAPTIPNAVSTTLIGSTVTQKTYLVVMPDSTSDSTVATEATTDGYVSTPISTTRDICNFTASTYTWVVGGTATKAPADWKITLADDVCGNDRLAEIQATYPGLTVSTDADGTCVHTYKITNYSEPIEPGCYPDDYRFVEPSPFAGIRWVKFITTLTTPDCTVDTVENPCVAVGVIFESKVEELPKIDTNTYFFQGYDVNRVDPVHIEVSVQSLDPNSNLCDEPEYPVTKLQSMKFPIGQGRYVMEREKEQLHFEGKNISLNPIVNDKFGFVFNAKDGKFYDEYQLGYRKQFIDGGWTDESTKSYIVSIFFEEGQGKQFETLINGLIAKQGLKLKPVYL